VKLAARDIKKYLQQPVPAKPALLIYGLDAGRVSAARSAVAAALAGANAADEMRLDRIAAADLRKEPALLVDAIKAQGFFPVPRVVVAEDGTVIDLGLTTAPGWPGYVAQPVDVANGEIRVGNDSAPLGDFAARAAASPMAASRAEPEPVTP